MNEQSVYKDTVNTELPVFQTVNTGFCGAFQLRILSNVLTCKYCGNNLRADAVRCLEEPL